MSSGCIPTIQKLMAFLKGTRSSVSYLSGFFWLTNVWFFFLVFGSWFCLIAFSQRCHHMPDILNTWTHGLKVILFWKIYDNIHMTRMSCSNTYSAELHNHLIWLKINPKYSMQNYTYFRQMYQECLKQNI